MDCEDVYEEVGRQKQGSEVPDRCRNVINELIDTEGSYLNSLRDVLHGYQEPIRVQTHLPVKSEDVDIIFGNTQELHKFSKRLLKLFEISQNDLLGLASIFLDRQSDFKIFTTYCTNHPRSIKTLNSCQQQPTAAEFFYGCQLALGHMLPLSAFLLKPVQRILKYHLLLADLLKQYGKAVNTEDSTYIALQEAQLAMAGVANYINAMMRREEARELLTMVQGWDPAVDAGSLVTEGVFRCLGAKVKRKVYVFENLVLMTKRHKDNVSYVYKGHILHSSLVVAESPAGSRDPTAFQLSSTDNKTDPKASIILFAKDVDHKAKWLSQLRRLMLEHHPNLPRDARKKMMESIEHGGLVSLRKDGELPAAPAAASKPASPEPKERLQRQRVTKVKRVASKDKYSNTTRLEPSENKTGPLLPAESLGSLDGDILTTVDQSSLETAEEIYSSIYAAAEENIYGDIGEHGGYCDDQLQSSSDNDSDHEEETDTMDGDKKPDDAVSVRAESTTDEILVSMDKPEVVVPMACDYRFSAPQQREPRPSASTPGIDRIGSRSHGGYSMWADPTPASRTSRDSVKLQRESQKTPSKAQVEQDQKQKEKSMELTKGLVGRLVKKYTELTEDKPEKVAVPTRSMSRQHSCGVVAVANRNREKSRSSITADASVARNELKWERTAPAAVSKLDAHQAKAKSRPADRASVSMKRSKSSYLLMASEIADLSPLVQRCGSITGVEVTGVTCPMAAGKEDASYPSLYAVSAELRRDSWRINRKMQLDRPAVAYSGTKTVAYTDTISGRRKSRRGSSSSSAPISTGRVRDLIAKFSVQPM